MIKRRNRHADERPNQLVCVCDLPITQKEMVMSGDGQDKVSAFDALFTNSQIQMLKVLMPYFDRSLHKNIAIMIKYMELQYTMSFFQKHPYATLPETEDIAEGPGFMSLIKQLLPFFPPKERETFAGMQSMFETFENYKNMMDMVESMKAMFPEGANPFTDIGAMMGGETRAAEAEPEKSNDSTESNGTQSDMAAQMAQMTQMAQMFEMISSMQNNAEVKSEADQVDENLDSI